MTFAKCHWGGGHALILVMWHSQQTSLDRFFKFQELDLSSEGNWNFMTVDKAFISFL